MITAKEAREISSNSTKYLKQIEDLIKAAASDGHFQIEFYFLPERDINILKDKGYSVSDAPIVEKASMGSPLNVKSRNVSW